MQNNLKLKEELDSISEAWLSESSVKVKCTVIAFPKTVPSSSALWFLLLLSLLVVDGLLTYIGISLSSTKYEANILVRSTMELLGVGAGIVLSKAFAVLSLYILWYFRRDIVWIFTAIKGLVFVYLSLAIVPWVYVFSYYLFPLV